MHTRYTNAKKDYIKLKNTHPPTHTNTHINTHTCEMVGGRIENNNICKFEYFGEDPTEQEIIMSCSIFKLHSMYKDITIYANGLRKLIEYICDPTTSLNIHMILYYDHSVEKDQLFIDLKTYALANNKKVQLCKYHCSDFIDRTNDLHRGIFGMFMRLYPFFEKKYEKNLKFISDIDFNDREIMFFCKHVPEKILESDNDFHCIQKIGYEWNYVNYFRNKYLSGMCLAVIYIKNQSLPIKLLEDGLEQLKNNDPVLLDFMRKIYKSKYGNDTEKINEVTTFTYGFDEWFINNRVINYIFEKFKRMGIFYISDNLGIYPKQSIDWTNVSEETKTDFYKKVLGNKATNNNYVNAKNLSKYFSLYVVTIEEYEEHFNIIKKFYDTVKVFAKDNKLKVTSDDWMVNLKKHIDSHYMVNFFYFLNTDHNRDKLYNFLVENTQIKTLTIDN
jgi:hypothetical protein